MKKYDIRIECKEGELEKIMNRLNKAQEEIYKCYVELERLGVLTIRKATAEEDDGERAIQ